MKKQLALEEEMLSQNRKMFLTFANWQECPVSFLISFFFPHLGKEYLLRQWRSFVPSMLRSGRLIFFFTIYTKLLFFFEIIPSFLFFLDIAGFEVDKNEHRRSGSRIKREQLLHHQLKELKLFLPFHNYHALQLLRILFCSSCDLRRDRSLRKLPSIPVVRWTKYGQRSWNNCFDDARVAAVLQNRWLLQKADWT